MLFRLDAGGFPDSRPLLVAISQWGLILALRISDGPLALGGRTVIFAPFEGVKELSRGAETVTNNGIAGLLVGFNERPTVGPPSINEVFARGRAPQGEIRAYRRPALMKPVRATRLKAVSGSLIDGELVGEIDRHGQTSVALGAAMVFGSHQRART